MLRSHAFHSSLPAVLLAFGLALALSACGDDDDDGGDEGRAGSAAGKGGAPAGRGAHDAGAQAGTSGSARPDAATPAPQACDVVPPTKCPDPAPDYADVEQIIAKRCLSCHDGKGEQWPLVSESHVLSWFMQIRDAMIRCQMPPADSGITMPTEERETILKWLRCKF